MPNSTILNQILHDVLHHAPDCEAAAYLDLQTGRQLGLYIYPSLHTEYEPDIMNTVIHLMTEIFNGKHLVQLTEHFKYQKNLLPDEEYFQELSIHGLHHSYICIRSEHNPQHMLIFVFTNDVVKGMMLREAKQFTKDIQERVKQFDIKYDIKDDNFVILDNPIPTPKGQMKHISSHENHPYPSTMKSNHQSNDILSALDRWLGR